MSKSKLIKPQLEAEYEARLLGTMMNLRSYYNDCVKIMAEEGAGEIDLETAKDRMNDVDARWAKVLVDDLAPLKHIIEA